MAQSYRRVGRGKELRRRGESCQATSSGAVCSDENGVDGRDEVQKLILMGQNLGLAAGRRRKSGWLYFLSFDGEGLVLPSSIATQSSASRDESKYPGILKKPWTMPLYSRFFTLTPALRSFLA